MHVFAGKYLPGHFARKKYMLKACAIGLCKGGICLAMGFETFVKDNCKLFPEWARFF